MKKILLTLTVGAGLLSAVAHAAATDKAPAQPKPGQPSAQIVEYGRYAAAAEGHRQEGGEPGSVVLQSTTVTHVETTTRIPARAGEAFGLKYELSNLPTDRAFDIRVVMLHPPIKRPDGKTETRSESTKHVEAGEAEAQQVYVRNTRWFFVKGFENEMVPGTWTRQIFVDDKKVAEQSFEVYRP